MTKFISGESIGNESDHEYADFLARINARFIGVTMAGTSPLFATDAAGMFAAYLASFPEGDARQHHNCNACRQFIERYGALVTIDSDGSTRPAVWNDEDAPASCKPAIAALARIVQRAKVTGVFLSSNLIWGLPLTGTWRHFSVMSPKVFCKAAQTAGQAMAEKREDFKNVSRALAEFTLPMIEQALTLLETDSLYRSETVLGPAKWLRDLHTACASTGAQRKENVVWRAIATAPAGFCHPRSSMIGTLLEDLAAGMDFEEVASRFATKMSPSNYQRAQVAPTAGAIAAAEKLFEQIGLAPALARRYARLSEIPTRWKSRAGAPPAEATAGTVFGHLTPKAQAPELPSLEIPPTTMTWEKFSRTVLPDAEAIEVQMPATSERLMALVTAADEKAPPILRWDTPEERNPVSWYYAAGIDAEVKRRVVGAGGQYENVDIRASLIWNNRNDLDLHVCTPAGVRIYYGMKQSPCGGWLDVDMNVRGETTSPVENTRWSRGEAPHGRYSVQVANYRYHERDHAPTPFRIELEVNGDVFLYESSVLDATGSAPSLTAASFVYSKGTKIDAARDLGPRWRAAGTRVDEWGVAAGRLCKVTAITDSPNLWGKNPNPHGGRHIFFLIDGCKDQLKGLGRGFFTETLRSDLHGVRSVLEAYNASATIAGAEEADACGLGMTDQAPWNVLLRVMSGGRKVDYKLDRWD